MKAKIFNVQSLLWLALVLALAGSLKHLAAIFASIDGNIFMGWLQAIAIDAGLFALAYSIRVRKVAKRSTKPLWFGVILFSAISVYGNYTYGLLAIGDTLPNWIAASRPIVLAASLPILVLYLAEMVSDDRAHLAKEAAKEAKRQARKRKKATGKTAVAAQNGNQLATINADRIATKEQRLETLADILERKPEATNTELATILDVSRATVRNYKKEIAVNGQGA